MQHLMDNHLRIAAIGDLHIRTTVPSELVRQALFLDSHADVLVITGDITNGGRIQEVEIACDLLKRVRIPMLTVLGNHDRRTTPPQALHFDSRKQRDTRARSRDLYGRWRRLRRSRGSGGGFWPEAESTPTNRAVQAMAVRARREAGRLDQALASLDTPVKVAVLHFAPTVTTLAGEARGQIPVA